jgi:vitamin B12 transporter
MRAPILASILGLILQGMVSGQVQAADTDSLEAVVVTATRIPTPEIQVASSITVITADEIEARQERTLPDVLKDVPGLNVVQTGGPGAQTSVFMRGTDSNHTKVLVDGIDVSDPSNPNATFDFGQLLTQDIERVEVLRGPQSGLYGSDAIGGVINIITKSGQGPLQAAVSAEGGSFDTFNQTGSLSGSDDQFHYSANVAHFHSGATPVTPLDLLAPGEQRNDDYYDNFTASTKLGLDVTQGFDLGLVARYTNTHLLFTAQDYNVYPTIPDAQQSGSNTNEYYARITAHLLSFDGVLSQTLGVAYTRNETANLAPETPESLDTGDRVKVDWQGAIKVSAADTLLLGVEDAQDEISQPISASIRIASGYAELQSQLAERWFSAVNVRYDDNDRFGSKVTYRFAPTYVNTDSGTKLKASVGTGFKAPSLSQLFQNFPPFFYGDPNLKPESSTGYDAGFEQALANDTIRFGATYFYNRIRDLITSNVTDTSYANIGKATTEGVESFVSYQPIKQLVLRVDYTFTEASDDILHQELVRRPKNKGSFNAEWHATDALLFDVDVLSVGTWVDGNRDFSIPRLDAPPYTTVNIATSYDLNARVVLFARIDNLLDRHYQNPVGFLQPSIGAFAGIKLKL